MGGLDAMREIIHEDSITLYWEKDEAWAHPCRFEALLDGVRIGVTDKTHFTFGDLRPETTYQVQIENQRLREAGNHTGQCMHFRINGIGT